MHCLCLLGLLAATVAATGSSSGSGSSGGGPHPAQEPANGSKANNSTPYVPDLPGAGEARAWLVAYHEQRQGQAEDPPVWPPALRLPSCTALRTNAAAAAAGLHGEQAERGRQPKRHMILATVGDDWGPEASKNRRGCALAADCPTSCLLPWDHSTQLHGTFPTDCPHCCACLQVVGRPPARYQL